MGFFGKFPSGTDWSRVPFLTGALVSFIAAAWIIGTSERGQVLAGALIAIGSVLTGGLLVDWAQRGQYHDHRRHDDQE